MTEYSITVSDPADKALNECILQRLNRFNTDITGFAHGNFSVCLQGKDGDIAGGAICYFYGKDCFVTHTWIKETLRGRGYGRKIMREAEKQAQKNNCNRITLSTWDFQARPFYEATGYRCIAEIKEHVGTYSLYYMRKVF